MSASDPPTGSNMLCPCSSQTNTAHTPHIHYHFDGNLTGHEDCRFVFRRSRIRTSAHRKAILNKASLVRSLDMARTMQIVVTTPCSFAGELMTFRHNLLPLPPCLWVSFCDIPVIPTSLHGIISTKPVYMEWSLEFLNLCRFQTYYRLRTPFGRVEV
jgi:hypothetical protein